MTFFTLASHMAYLKLSMAYIIELFNKYAQVYNVYGTFCGRVDLAETAFTIVVMFSLENPLLSSELFQKFKTSKQVILRWQPVSTKAPFFYFEDNNI